jgi:hypothetical protein
MEAQVTTKGKSSLVLERYSFDMLTNVPIDYYHMKALSLISISRRPA